MVTESITLAGLLRRRLLAQADLFSTLTDHPSLLGSARERALAELLREVVPRRLEILTGAIARLDGTGEPRAATSQIDLMVVDTMDYPTILRAGETAIVLPQSVRAVVEVKSDLGKGEKFWEAMDQIGLVRRNALDAGMNNQFVTALFSFASPTNPETLRGWLEDLLAERARRVAPGRDAFAAANLPHIIMSDGGAVAMKRDLVVPAQGGSLARVYRFFRTDAGAPSAVALVDQILQRIAESLSDATHVDSPAATRLASAFAIASKFLNVPLLEAANCQPLVLND
jgi:hypothetical protein